MPNSSQLTKKIFLDLFKMSLLCDQEVESNEHLVLHCMTTINL